MVFTIPFIIGFIGFLMAVLECCGIGFYVPVFLRLVFISDGFMMLFIDIPLLIMYWQMSEE